MAETNPPFFKWFRVKYGITIKALGCVLVLILAKLAIDHFNLSIIAVNPLITAFMGGVFFTIGVLFAGAVSDYKEAEKIPGDLAVSLKAFYNDTRVIPVEEKDRKVIEELQGHIKELLYVINSNFRRNVWKLREIDGVMNAINEDMAILGKIGVAPTFLTKLRSELTTIDRLAHRTDTIVETTFIPAAYTIAEVAIGTVLFLLLFLKIECAYGGVVLLGVISLVLISLLLMIKDMDNPFEYGKNTYANADLTILFSLEEYWKKG